MQKTFSYQDAIRHVASRLTEQEAVRNAGQARKHANAMRERLDHARLACERAAKEYAEAMLVLNAVREHAKGTWLL